MKEGHLFEIQCHAYPEQGIRNEGDHPAGDLKFKYTQVIRSQDVDGYFKINTEKTFKLFAGRKINNT